MRSADNTRVYRAPQRLTNDGMRRFSHHSPKNPANSLLLIQIFILVIFISNQENPLALNATHNPHYTHDYASLKPTPHQKPLPIA